MRIGIDASRANISEKTGVEWYAFHLIESLKQAIPGDVDVVLYSREPLEGALARLPENWSSRVLRWLPRFLSTQLRLSAEMLFRPPDILFIPASAAPLIHPRRTIVTVHDIAARTQPEAYSWFGRWYSLFTAGHALRHCAAVIVPTRVVADELRTLVRRPKATIQVVHHGFALSSVPADLDLSSLGVTKPYILSIGRIETKKNTVRIIESFDALRAAGHDLQLVLIGIGGEGAAVVRQRGADSPYAEDIVFTGYLDEARKLALLAGAKVFVYPSLAEGFGMPILEAFALSAPVVTSDLPVLREVGGEAPLYVDPYDTEGITRATAIFLRDSELAVRHTALGGERLSVFSWSRCATETLRVMMEM